MEGSGDAASVNVEANARVQDGRPNIVESMEGRVKRSAVGEQGKLGHSDGVALVMDPAMWSSLPRELLPLVFACLPSSQLLSLRRSAIGGKWNIDLTGSEFMSLCAQRHGKMCAVVVKEPDSPIYNVGVHTTGESIVWQKLRLSTGEPVSTMTSSDGGLVCFALTLQSLKEEAPLWVKLAVVNPLTCECRVLPKHGVSPFQLKMMKLVRDRNTGCYQVTLVYSEGVSNAEFPPFRALSFCSETGVWTDAKNFPQLLLGPTLHDELYIDKSVYGWAGARLNQSFYKMDSSVSTSIRSPCAYETATGEVIYTEEGFDDYADSFHFALVEDHLFLMELNWCGDGGTAEYILSEHQFQVRKDELSWKELKKDHFGPTEHQTLDGSHSDCCLHLCACEGFLLVAGSYNKPVGEDFANPRRFDPVDYEVALLHNLETGEWIDILNQGDDSHSIGLSPIMMCELQWETLP